MRMQPIRYTEKILCRSPLCCNLGDSYARVVRAPSVHEHENSAMLIGLILIWLMTAVGLWLVTLLVPGVRARSAGDLLLAALVLGLINASIRPLIWMLTLPLTVLTFGLFALLINALMVKLTAYVVSGFEVDHFGDALLAAVLMTLLAIAGFVFLQWFLFDAVFWMQMGPGHPRFGF